MSSARRSLESSPRAWGCFQRLAVTGDSEKVFPTCVGVFPLSIEKGLILSGLPHVRGGVSSSSDVKEGL